MSKMLRSFITWTCVAFLVIAGFFVITEHKAYAFGALPILLLLACPLLHMLSHGRHHGGDEPSRGHNHNTMPVKGRAP
jgi:hypothetical protein